MSEPQKKIELTRDDLINNQRVNLSFKCLELEVELGMAQQELKKANERIEELEKQLQLPMVDKVDKPMVDKVDKPMVDKVDKPMADERPIGKPAKAA